MVVHTFDSSVVAAKLGITRRDDDFSAQFFSAGDPRFFLRTLMPVEEPVQITDFLPGDLNEGDQAACLAYMLRDLDRPKAGALHFSNVQDGPRGTAETELARISRVVELYAFSDSRFIADMEPGGASDRRHLIVRFRSI